MFHGTGLPPDILLPLLESLRADIAEIREAVAKVHMRMVGASLLIVYEADWDRCREGLKYLLEAEAEEDDDEDENDDDDDDENNGENGGKKPAAPYVVKLIDFAHTRFAPGQGPDEGVLTGIDTVLRLLDGRIQEVGTLSGSATPSECA